MQEYFKILKKCLLFDGIEDADLWRMLECLGARVVFFDKKYTIFAEGTPAKYIGIVLSGAVQTVHVDYYGNRSIFSELGAGEVFSEAFACSGEPLLPVSVIATEPSQIMLIDSSHILHTCAKHCLFHQRLIFNLMRNLAVKTIQFHRRVEITSKRTTREKLLTYLAMQAKQVGRNSFTIPFDRQELADYLEVDRSGLSAEIGKLRREGILESEKNRFTLL